MRAHEVPVAEDRIKVQDVKKYGILAFDVDNAYPQRMVSLINASGTAKQAVGLYSKFIVGAGFQDATFYKTVIDAKGITPDRLLRRIGYDFAQFRGFAIHVNYNALYEVASASYMPFENLRLTMAGAEEIGVRPNMVAVHKNWAKRSAYIGRTTLVKKEDIEYLHRFNPDAAVIEQEVLLAGGWENYKGQVYWFSADFDAYPLSSIDAVIEPIKAEIASDRTTTSNLANNFSLKTVYVVKGEFEDDEEREEYLAVIKKFLGPDGEQVMIAEAKSDDEIPEMKKVETALNDKLFEYTDNKVVRKIIRHFNQPAILHSITDSGYFNQEQMADSMTYYNGVTQDERYEVEQAFTDIFSRFAEPINPSGNFAIIPLKYGENQQVDGNA